MPRKDFKKHNKKFICLYCKEENPPSAHGSERNHCRKCLFSLHVDQDVPGDRKSKCRGLIAPLALEYKGAKGFMILHRCEKCGKKMLNKTADDDNIEKIASCGG